jgi:PAS domain S-box-containing protein
MRTQLVEALEQLRPHDHLCLIYETQEEQFAAAVPFLCMGLERGEKCVYIADDHTCAEVLQALRAGGIDVESAIQSGALSLATKRESYLKQGYFDPDWMIRFLKDATGSAMAAGFSALRATGEMTWQLGGDPGTERLIEYESKLNYFYAEHNCVDICQYDRRRFSPAVIRDVIRTHPLVICDGTVCRNLYYVPPNEFLKPNQTAREVERLLGTIREREDVDNELRRARDELEARVLERTAELEKANQALQAEIAERTRAMQALETSQERYRHLFDNANDIIFTLDLQGNFTSLNPSVERITGYRRAEILPMNIAQIAAPESRELVFDMLRAKLGGVERTTYEAAVLARDGRKVLLEVSSRLQFREGKPVGVHGVARDMTERKQAERALKESEAQYRTLFETMAQGVVYQDAQGKITSANPASESILGLTLEQMQNRTSLDPRWRAIHPDGSPFPGETDPSVVALNTGIEVRDVPMGVFNPQNDEYRWLRIDAFPQFQPGEERPYQVYTIFQDVTERKRTQDSLRTQKEVLETIFDHIPVMVSLFGPDGKIRMANREWERVLGWTLEEANAGDFWAEAYPHPADRQAVRDFVASSTTEWRDFRTRVRDGRTIDTCWANARLSDGSVIGIGQDVTARKRAEEALRESQAALHRNGEELRALAAGLLTAQEEERRRVSRELHDDLNQKLAMLAVDIEALEQQLPASFEPLLDQLGSLRSRVVELSDDLRRVAYQLHPSMLEHLGLAVALKSYCAEFSKREKIKARLAPRDLPDALPQDVALCLYRVAQEALRNVARHSGSPRAAVSLTRTAGGIHLSIIDFGVGFDPDLPRGRGGLGFISMQERVRLVGGSWSVKSRPGQGTRIDVRIPLERKS